MLTFERVLNAFEDILQQDPLYEVVSTSHGYTLLAWDEHSGTAQSFWKRRKPCWMRYWVFIPVIWNLNFWGMSGMI